MKMLIRLNFCSVSKIEGGGGLLCVAIINIVRNIRNEPQIQKWASRRPHSLSIRRNQFWFFWWSGMRLRLRRLMNPIQSKGIHVSSLSPFMKKWWNVDQGLSYSTSLALELTVPCHGGGAVCIWIWYISRRPITQIFNYCAPWSAVTSHASLSPLLASWVLIEPSTRQVLIETSKRSSALSSALSSPSTSSSSSALSPSASSHNFQQLEFPGWKVYSDMTGLRRRDEGKSVKLFWWKKGKVRRRWEEVQAIVSSLNGRPQ